jgi:hypothetical protein
MGLITGLLTLPLAPVRGVAWIGEQIAEEADREFDPDARVRRQLAELELAHDLGQISDEEFALREEAIFDGE